MEINNLTEEDWIAEIKSSMTNNDKNYTMTEWMRLETGKSTRKIKYELDKLVDKGVLLRVTSNKGIRYLFKKT